MDGAAMGGNKAGLKRERESNRRMSGPKHRQQREKGNARTSPFKEEKKKKMGIKMEAYGDEKRRGEAKS